MNITLYVIVPNGFTFFFNANDNTPQLFNGNGKVNRELLAKKREEIYGLPMASRGLGRPTILMGDKSNLIPQLLRQPGYVNNG